MFDFDCPECHQRQLIFPSRIRHLVNDDAGIAVVFHCWCGRPSAKRFGGAPSADSPDARLPGELALQS